MKTFKNFVLIGQIGGRKWIIGDYATEIEALIIMNSKTKGYEKQRKGKPGPPLRVTILKFIDVYDVFRSFG